MVIFNSYVKLPEGILVGYDLGDRPGARSRPGHSLPKHCPSVPVRGVSSLQQPWPRIDPGSDAERPNAAWQGHQAIRDEFLGSQGTSNSTNMDSNIWVCLKIGYIPNYSHLIGIMIINHWV